MLGVVVVATAVAALIARNVYQHTPSGSPPPVVSTTETSVAPGAEPGSPIVTVAPDVANSSDGKQVQQLLQAYFDAINDRDYGSLLSIVTPQYAANESESKFMSDFHTTKDGTIRVVRIDPTATGLSVLVTFHSEQDIAHAPPFAKYQCVAWQIVWPLVRVDGDLRLDSGPAATPPTQQCS